MTWPAAGAQFVFCGDSWSTILVYFNGNTTSQQITLPSVPSGTWNLVVDPCVASQTPIGTLSGNITLEPLSAYVMYQ